MVVGYHYVQLDRPLAAKMAGRLVEAGGPLQWNDRRVSLSASPAYSGVVAAPSARLRAARRRR